MVQEPSGESGVGGRAGIEEQGRVGSQRVVAVRLGELATKVLAVVRPAPMAVNSPSSTPPRWAYVATCAFIT